MREQGHPQTGSLSVTNGAARDPAAETRCQLFPMIFLRLAFTAKAADGIILLVLNPMLAR